MNLDVVLMNGYGFYVWASFLLTFLICLFLFLKTRKTLKKYEKEFLAELEALSETERKAILEKSLVVPYKELGLPMDEFWFNIAAPGESTGWHNHKENHY